MLHVYYGDGKGKTTAAIGLAVRALGCGQTVCLVQFLKGRGTGEVDFLEKTPGITILRGKTAACFTFQMNEAQKAECAVRQAEIFAEGMAMARQGLCFIPAVWLLEHAFGLLGVQLAQPVADFLSFLLAIPLTLPVLRGLREKEAAKKVSKP